MITDLLSKIRALRIDDVLHDPDEMTIEDYIEMSSYNNTRNKSLNEVIELIEPYLVYDELVDKVTQWLDESQDDKDIEYLCDLAEIRGVEIRELLNKIKALPERSIK